MSTEHKSGSTDQNALASGLQTGWTKFKQGKLIAYHWMALILLVVAGIGGTWWILHERRGAESAKWTKWEGLGTISSLEEFAKENPGTIQAKLATLEVARLQLAEGIEGMSVSDPIRQRVAVENVEKAREAFVKLVEEFKDDPILKPECIYGCAKAEAALVGVPKEGQLEQFRGDPNKVVEWLDKLAEAAPDTEWAKDAKKLADTLRNQTTREQVVALQSRVYTLPMPKLPGFDPKFPFDPKLPPLTGPGPGGKGK